MRPPGGEVVPPASLYGIARLLTFALVFSKKKKLSRVNFLDVFAVESMVMPYYLKFIRYTDMYLREPIVKIVHVQAQ